MHITRAGEYAIFGVLYLARQPQGRVVMIEEISKAILVPQSYLAKIFQPLAKAGVVQSHRGSLGGFSLARRPQDIGVLEVIQSVEGPVEVQVCLGQPSECIISKTLVSQCNVRSLLAKAQGKFIEVLAQTTIADLMAEQTPTATVAEGGRLKPET